MQYIIAFVNVSLVTTEVYYSVFKITNIFISSPKLAILLSELHQWTV